MKTLLLNSTYEPMKFISERKTIKHVLNDKVERISAWDYGFKHDHGYCVVCGANLEYHPKAHRVEYKGAEYRLCTSDCAEYFEIDPKEYLMPAIVRLKTYAPRHIKKRRYNRTGVFKRDKHTCQYCAVKFKPSDLTIDHVLPRAMGGQTSWENCVTCCNECNNKKADRTPKMAKMKLLKKPVKPAAAVWHDYNAMSRKHEDWKEYIIHYKS